MLTLTDPAAIWAAARDPTLDPYLRAVLALRLRQPGADFHVVQAGDALAEAEAAVGWPLSLEGAPQFDWAERHPGGVTEVCFVLSDDGPAQVLLVPPDADHAITDLLRDHAAG